MQAKLAPYVVRIDHVGIAVPDLDQAIALYTDLFGAQVVHREHNAEQLIDEAMLRIGDSTTLLQFIAPSGPASPIENFLEKHGPGLQQMAYEVSDVEAAADAARGQGIRVLYDAARRGTADSRINFLHPKDCGGVLIELVEKPSN